jgi:hypothetical protein
MRAESGLAIVGLWSAVEYEVKPWLLILRGPSDCPELDPGKPHAISMLTGPETLKTHCRASQY